jgi:hypothetical protein
MQVSTAPFSIQTASWTILCPAVPRCALLCAAGYPEARAALDLEALRLQPFYAGARVWFDGGWHTVGWECVGVVFCVFGAGGHDEVLRLLRSCRHLIC